MPGRSREIQPFVFVDDATPPAAMTCCASRAIQSEVETADGKHFGKAHAHGRKAPTRPTVASYRIVMTLISAIRGADNLTEKQMITARNPNEQVVLDFFAGLNADDLDAVRSQLAPDIQWSPMVTGVPGYDIDSIFTGLLPYLRSIFAPGDPQQAVRTITPADDMVVAETRCTGAVPSKDNSLYENDYCWVIELEKGKIKKIREYLDIDKVRSFFG